MYTNNKVNVTKLLESWAPVISDMTKGAVDAKSEKMEWIAKLANNEQMHLNEEAVGGIGMPYATLNNTLGIGNAVPASAAAMTGAEQTSNNAIGSGDKWPSLLPVAIQVAARTVGFDLVNVTTLDGPTGVLPFIDYVYADSKEPYGATPGYNPATANPQTAWKKRGGEGKAYTTFDNMTMFQVKAVLPTFADGATKVSRRQMDKALFESTREDGSIITLDGGINGKLDVKYVSMTRLGAEPIFKIDDNAENVANIGKLFEGAVTAKVKVAKDKDTTEELTFTFSNPRAVSMWEDQILGYTGSGKYDSDNYSGTYMNPFKLYEPMDRATGETQVPRKLSMTVHTEFITVGKIQVAVNVTREQVTDLQKQWGIDVLKMVENAAINELTQTINKQITSRLFGLGWLNHVNAYASEGVNLNLNLGTAGALPNGMDFATVKDGEEVLLNMPIPDANDYGNFENLDTKFSRVAKLVKTAGNLIMQRGRRGPANFIVTNYKIASMLQDQAQYTFAPLANTFNQNNGQLYPLGTVAGMTVYVDPYMRYDDTRVLIGRKGEKTEPGVHFCPYLMAESVNFINQNTMAPQVVVSSRYALVNVGWYPETQYLTLFINTPENMY